ncbi:AAA family ATPase [Pontibacillus yanchengensis]|uniref:AAA family ATPase n=2 Tax=Pontibacillus yanchengensis TaxID=462910 RepID=A0ACC7VFF8_9BACI|nr:AAA family ATPase [Pontibacillus yanchengensis]MYL32371.1 AAA family ATPase [Pontibacillus yanchengensis]MYL52951.1 AAA family ATPase [Pontibacillus yanchengensis]
MKLIEVHIYGFGKWVNETIQFSEEGLSYVYGKNEAGKSTLHQFILYILFSLPPRKLQAFKPQRGGVVGGSLVIETPAWGRIKIERQPDKYDGEARCYTNNGEEKEESFLKELLNGVDRFTYEAIFSFGLHDIQHVQQLHSDDIGDILFGIGMTGSREIYDVEKKLEKELDQRFKKQGKNPQLNQQLVSVREKEQLFQASKQGEEQYASLKKQENNLQNELEALQNKYKDVETSIDELERKQQAVQPLLAYQQLQEEEKEYEEDLSFPENGMERYYHLKDQYLPLKSELEVIEQNEKTYRDKQRDLYEVDERILESLKDLEQKKQRNDVKKEQRDHLNQEIEQRTKKVKDEIESLGIELTIDDVENIEFPFYIEEHWQMLSKQQRDIELEDEQYQQQKRVNKEREQQLLSEKETLEQSLLSEQVYDHYQAEVDRQYEQDVQQKIDNQHKQQQDSLEAYHRRIIALTNQVLIGVAVLFAIGISMSFLFNNWWFGIGTFGLFGIVVMGVSMIRNSLPNVDTSIGEKIVDENESSTTSLTWYKEQLATHDRIKTELEQFSYQVQQLHGEMMKLDERFASLDRQRQRFYQQVEEQMEMYSFLRHVDLDFWPKAYQKVMSHKESLEHIREQEQDVQQLKNDISSYEEQVETLASQVDIDTNVSIEEKENQLFQLKAFIQKQLELKDTYTEWLFTIEQQKQDVREKMKPFEEEIRKLFRFANVEDEEAYIQTGNKINRLYDIKHNKKQYYEQLYSIYLNNDKVKSLLSSSLDSSFIQQERQEKTKRKQELSNQIDSVRQQLSDTLSHLRTLEGDESISKYRHELEFEKSLLKEQAMEWAVYKVAYSMLRKTKSTFQQERMPMVLEYCKQFFSILTNNTYVHVFVPSSEEGLVVETQSGDRYTAEQLSQGTKEQLYVALRLSLSRVMSDQHGMPFIIDDAYVNFDEERTKEFLTLLTNISRTQQVIVLSCRQYIQDILNKQQIIFL